MSVSKSSVSNKTKRKYRKGNGPFTIVMTFAFILKQTNKQKSIWEHVNLPGVFITICHSKIQGNNRTLT